MMKFMKSFKSNEDGAVTVDWVVLTAAVVGLAIAAYTSIETGAGNLTQSTSTYLTTGIGAIGTIGAAAEATD